MSEDAKELTETLSRREHLAEQVLINKQAVIDNDRQRNRNREGLNQIKKSEDKKMWMHIGDMFIKLPTPTVKQVIEKEQNELTDSIEEARRTMKIKARELEKIEGTNNLAGFDLGAISSQELYNINK
ncbi:hypothetical protein BCR43DRAFT_483023 [Syncephalastrum racemosum]|uniref:Uncharacterized protein n=1 Tax=Syncephalastrum racemosum TaxID=13706 RepID=A0A1X2HUI0_SYNRA|nr:hypothetical protein BCR43DRAFT_483023 [Syncephalastrum racemosum]